MKNMVRGYKRREGFSLVELLIVMGIISIVTGFLALGMGYISQGNAKKCVNSINSSLTELKAECTAKSEKVYMHLYCYDGKYFVDYTGEKDYSPTGVGQEIGSASGIDMFYGAGAGASTQLTDGGVLTFSMRKTDGAFSDADAEEIKVSGTSDYKVVIVPATGRHYIEQE